MSVFLSSRARASRRMLSAPQTNPIWEGSSRACRSDDGKLRLGRTLGRASRFAFRVVLLDKKPPPVQRGFGHENVSLATKDIAAELVRHCQPKSDQRRHRPTLMSFVEVRHFHRHQQIEGQPRWSSRFKSLPALEPL